MVNDISEEALHYRASFKIMQEQTALSFMFSIRNINALFLIGYGLSMILALACYTSLAR